MRTKKMFSPDASDSGTAPVTTAFKHTKSLIPANVGNLWDMADRVCTKWGTVPELVCFWKTQSAFAKDVNDLGLLIGKRNISGGNITSQSDILQQLDITVETGIKKIKLYLEDKYNSKAAAQKQYGRFGIIKIGSNYTLPIDRELRLQSFETLLKGIVTDDFGNKEYGNAFFWKLQLDYKVALKQIKDTQQAVSGVVGQKEVLQKEVEKLLRTILKLLDGNYPDTYDSVILEWGYKRR